MRDITKTATARADARLILARVYGKFKPGVFCTKAARVLA
jgi:hypothetical protein